MIGKTQLLGGSPTAMCEYKAPTRSKTSPGVSPFLQSLKAGDEDRDDAQDFGDADQGEQVRRIPQVCRDVNRRGDSQHVGP